MDAGGRVAPGAAAEGWGEGTVGALAFMNHPLILDRLFPTRSTASIPGGVAFSRREKGWGFLCCTVHSPPWH
jgi:hypothetical protein